MRMHISKIALAALLLAFSFTMLNCQSNAAHKSDDDASEENMEAKPDRRPKTGRRIQESFWRRTLRPSRSQPAS